MIVDSDDHILLPRCLIVGEYRYQS